MADHSATCILRRNFPDLIVTLLAFVMIWSDANLAKTSPPLCIGQGSVNIRPNFGQSSVNVRLNFGRKGGEKGGCLVDETCSEQSVSRPDGCFELSNLGLGSGDWYVRHQSGVRTPRSVDFALAVNTPSLNFRTTWVQTHKGQFNTIGLIKNRMGIFIRIHVLG